jgi:AcrR family transcriptional regulator
MDNTERTAQSTNASGERTPGAEVIPPTQGDLRRRSLVLAAYQLIAERGLEQLRTRDIAASAAVNIATLHYYFARKEDLIQAVVEYLLQQFQIAHQPEFPAQMKTPLERIRAELAEQQYLLQTHPDIFVVSSELVLRSRHDSAIYHMLTQLDQRWHSYLEQIIRDGCEQGIFRADLDPAKAATWLILLFKGTALHALTSPQSIDFNHLHAEIESWLTGAHGTPAGTDNAD